MLAANNPIAIYAIASILGGLALGCLTWVAGSLLKHAQILSVVTAALPQIQNDIRIHGAQIADLRTDHAHLQGALEAHGLLKPTPNEAR